MKVMRRVPMENHSIAVLRDRDRAWRGTGATPRWAARSAERCKQDEHQEGQRLLFANLRAGLSLAALYLLMTGAIPLRELYGHDPRLRPAL